MIFELKQSQYFTISSSETRAYTIKSGVAEVYACTPSLKTPEEAEDYHKMFLTQLSEGKSLFSPVEMLLPLEFQIFARADCMIEATEVRELPYNELAERAAEWFYELTTLHWIRFLIGLGDEVLSKWESRTIFNSGGNNADALFENLQTLSMLIDAQFKKAENGVEVKTEVRGRYKGRVLDAAMYNLLCTEYDSADYGKFSDGNVLRVMDDPSQLAVCAAAKFLGMDIENIFIPVDIAAKMDAVTKMRRLIKKANMQARLVSLPEGWHKNDNGVFLGYYGDDSGIVALLPKGSNEYVIIDGKHPNGISVDDEIASKIRKDAFMCYAGLPPKALKRADMFKFMLRHTTKHDWTIIWIISFLAGVLPILMPLITESIFRDIIPIGDRQALGTVTQVMLVSGFTTAVFELVRSFSFLRVKSHIGIAFESALWSRLLSLPAKFFRNYDVGNLVGRMQGVSSIIETVGGHALSSVFNTIFSFWSLVLMFYYNVTLALIAIAMWTAYLIVNAFFYKYIISAQRKMADASNNASAQTIQILNGLSKFRLQGGESSAFYLWSQTFGEQWKWNLKSRWCNNYMSLINVILPTILSMIIYYISMGIMESGLDKPKPTMDTAKFMGFYTALTGFSATLTAFVPIAATLFSTLPLVENIMPILEAEPEVTDDKADVSELSGEIEIENLHFAYSSDSPMVLKGISIRIKAGESVAIVGPSGCGKSTLVRILLGFEKPAQGVVLFDGQDFSTLNVASVRSQMGVVLQNGQILQGSVFDNIVGSASLTLDDAWEAARMVGLDKDIENMPMGMHTVISEGAGNISGGQKQRILLARSIVYKPKIVILDEATSALDNITQAIVTESMNKMKATRITVAHRLSTIRDVDRIFVFKDGCVIEEGNYEELMKADGLFAKLAKRQLG